MVKANFKSMHESGLLLCVRMLSFLIYRGGLCCICWSNSIELSRPLNEPGIGSLIAGQSLMKSVLHQLIIKKTFLACQIRQHNMDGLVRQDGQQGSQNLANGCHTMNIGAAFIRVEWVRTFSQEELVHLGLLCPGCEWPLEWVIIARSIVKKTAG